MPAKMKVPEKCPASTKISAILNLTTERGLTKKSSEISDKLLD